MNTSESIQNDQHLRYKLATFASGLALSAEAVGIPVLSYLEQGNPEAATGLNSAYITLMGATIVAASYSTFKYMMSLPPIQNTTSETE